jgi:hypothetical protein
MRWKQTFALAFSMSALCQQETHGAKQIASFFDQLVGAGEQCRWYGEAKGFCRLQIDD